MARYNYYASPSGSDRSRAFQNAYRNAPMGQDFWFENQPYARPGPPGLLAEEGAGTATGYRPIVRENPNNRAFMPPEMLARLEAKANEKRLGPRIGGRTKVLRDRSLHDKYVRRWVEPEGSFTQSPHGLETLEQQIQRDRWASDPYNAPRFPATNQMGVAKGYDHQMVNAPMGFGMSGPGQDTGQPQGLLTDDMSGPRWTDRWKKETVQEPNTDKSGWMADQRMRDSQNRNLGMANLLINFGKQQSSDDGWGGPLTHY